ncbi:MAG: hypothetical protein EON54_26620 [Alcaligenaceae bacterium]|nr:MAG: hypothetical protein EON54_26620 [Alcaligenaceae bacterium]
MQRTEYAIVKMNDPFALPFFWSHWTLEEASDAARYNSERWGPHQVVARQVTDWEVVDPAPPYHERMKQSLRFKEPAAIQMHKEWAQ